eukprot:6027021-Pleurochrysis_carterae.AAC.3
MRIVVSGFEQRVCVQGVRVRARVCTPCVTCAFQRRRRACNGQFCQLFGVNLAHQFAPDAECDQLHATAHMRWGWAFKLLRARDKRVGFGSCITASAVP